MLAWCIASASVEEIDKLNILQATMLAMSRAVAGLAVQPGRVLIDGNRVPKQISLPAEAIVKGMPRCRPFRQPPFWPRPRDAELIALDALHPQYGFARHKGYPTAEHLAALEQHGALAEHRKSFGPVKAWIARQQGQLF
jgi:ribonuclease HII